MITLTPRQIWKAEYSAIRKLDSQAHAKRDAINADRQILGRWIAFDSHDTKKGVSIHPLNRPYGNHYRYWVFANFNNCEGKGHKYRACVEEIRKDRIKSEKEGSNSHEYP